MMLGVVAITNATIWLTSENPYGSALGLGWTGLASAVLAYETFKGR